MWGPPDLVADVLSPGTQSFDRGEKLGSYRQYGVRECWLVDTAAEAITIVALTGPAPVERRVTSLDRVHSSVLLELRVPAVKLFM